MQTIILNESEFATAIAAAMYKITQGQFGKHISKRQPFWLNLSHGILAEYAVAKLLNIKYDPFTKPLNHKIDVGYLQVRSSTQDNARLVVTSKDYDDLPYVFCTLKDIVNENPPLEINIHGYIFGKDCKNEKKYLKQYGDNPPAYFISKNELLPLDIDLLKKYALQNG